MKREDIDQQALPYSALLDGAYSYLYFLRQWMFQGEQGTDGRTGVVLLTKSRAGDCRRFSSLLYWINKDPRHVHHQAILFDDAFDCNDFDEHMHQLVQAGILDIPDQKMNYVASNFSDIIGAQPSPDQQNWYSLAGFIHHTDERHQLNIFPFMNSDVIFGTILRS